MKIRRHYRKYKNVTCRCHNGHQHDSRGEAEYCDTLNLLKKKGEIKDYETQVTFPLEVNGHTICKHRVDFLITNKDGEQEVHEYKGGKITETAVWNIKRKLFEALIEDIAYVVVRG